MQSNANIKAKKRLYMTATPRLYEENTKKKAEENSVVLCSMDDESLYGKAKCVTLESLIVTRIRSSFLNAMYSLQDKKTMLILI